MSAFAALRDASLLRDLAHIDGAWVGADDGARFAVTFLFPK